MRRLPVILGFVVGAALALGVGIGVTVFAGLNRTWITIQVPVLEGLGHALEQGSAVRGRPVEGQLWFVLVAAFVAGLLTSVVVAFMVWAAGLAGRLRERRRIRDLEDELEDLREVAAARLSVPAQLPGAGPGPRPPAPPSPPRTAAAGPAVAQRSPAADASRPPPSDDASLGLLARAGGSGR